MSKICPMCGALMKTNVCEYCRYEMEVPEEKVQKEPEYYEKQIIVQPKIILNDSVSENYRQTVETVSSKSKILALILCFLFGYFGLHQFYVGKTVWGIVYFFTLGLFGVGWFIDILLIAFGIFRDKNGLPLK